MTTPKVRTGRPKKTKRGSRNSTLKQREIAKKEKAARMRQSTDGHYGLR